MPISESRSAAPLAAARAIRLHAAVAVLAAALVALALSLALGGAHVAYADGDDPGAGSAASTDVTAGSSDTTAAATDTTAAATPAKVRYKKGKPKVCVSDTNAKSAAGLASYLRKCGCKVKIVGTRKVNVKSYDGLAIAGGPDVTPRLYGQKNKHSSKCNPAKDKMQIAVIKKFKEAGKPILGVCRGQQIVNVALGGTLKQHIGWHNGNRKVKIAKGSWLYKAYGATEKVAHSHHQAIKQLGEGLVATQWDKKSKVIEGIQHETLPIFGVQWHPEYMGKRGQKVGKLFKKECQMIRS